MVRFWPVWSGCPGEAFPASPCLLRSNNPDSWFYPSAAEQLATHMPRDQILWPLLWAPLHVAGEASQARISRYHLWLSRDSILRKGEQFRSWTCVFGWRWQYGRTNSRNVGTCLVCSLDNEETVWRIPSGCARSHSWLAAGPLNPAPLLDYFMPASGQPRKTASLPFSVQSFFFLFILIKKF